MKKQTVIMKGALLCRNPVFPICFCATSFLPLPCNAVSDMSSSMRFSICATYFTLSEPWKCQKSQHQWKNEKTVQPKLYRSLFPHDVFLSGAAFPRLLIRKHKKVSKINVFKGRESVLQGVWGTPHQAKGGDSSESPPAVFWLQKTLLANFQSLSVSLIVKKTFHLTF